VSYKNALSTYKEIRINTASQGQLIIMLYNEAVKQLDQALHLLEMNDVNKDPGRLEQISKAIMKTQEVITELMVSLDFEQGGDIAVNLFSLYTWFNRELTEAIIKQDSRRISIIRNHIEELRVVWQEIAATNAVESPRHEILGVNIAG